MFKLFPIQASTAGYGPDDFIVETVNLDKNFFYQFFTSKPMIIDTDVVTSTSVQVRSSGELISSNFLFYQVKYDQKSKKGRDTEAELFQNGRETLMNLPEHLVGQELLPDHIIKKMGTAADTFEDYADEEMSVTDEEAMLDNASKYKRYHIPPEIQITLGRDGKELEAEETE